MDQSQSVEDFQDSQDSEVETSFDFNKFCFSIKKSVADNGMEADDVELESYLLAYEQLHNFFLLLGNAFQFVAMDVRSKIKILKTYQNNEKEKDKSVTKFSSVKNMINYEKENKLLMNKGYVSGSRTLLRLHRGLDFLRKFLTEIHKAKNDVKLGPIARKVYDETLAEHHSWVVRNAARLAMQFLPTRIDLLKKISENNEENLSNMLEVFPEALDAMNLVYDRVQDIYSCNDLLHLP